MRMFIKKLRAAKKAERRLDEIAERLAADAKIEYPRGTRFLVYDDRVLTDRGRAATREGVLSLDDVTAAEDLSPLAKVG